MRISSNKLHLAARCSTRIEDKATDCAQGQRNCNANAWTFFHVWPLKWLPRVSLTFEQIQLRQLAHGERETGVDFSVQTCHTGGLELPPRGHVTNNKAIQPDVPQLCALAPYDCLA